MTVIDTYINLIPISLLQGVIYGFVALGIMIPFRLLSFPDLTAEGSFPFGASIAAALIAAGFGPIAASACAVAGGFLAGTVTAAIHLTLRLNTLLCGILVLTMLYSIDIRVMGKPNIALFAYQEMFGLLLGPHAQSLAARIALVGAMLGALAVLLHVFLRTEIGMALRAVGASQSMARAQESISRYTIVGVGMAGALCALSGAVLAQNQAFADVNMGFGILVNGLAAVIVGEQLIGRGSLARQIAAPIVGALIYFQIVSLALALGLQPSDLKLVTGVFVLALLALPRIRGGVSLFDRNS